MRRATIIGTGMHAPERVVRNDYFDRLYQRDIGSFLEARRNIRERHFMAEGEVPSDLILPAACEALKNAGIAAEQLDLIIVATDTPDYISPATAAVVQHKLGAKRAGTFDVNAACAGFVTGLDIGSKYIAADSAYNHVLVVGAYGMSKYLDWDDYKTATMFADGAGAVVLSASKDANGILASHLHTEGCFHDYMGIYEQDGVAKLRFVKKIPTETNAQMWPELARIVLARCGRRPDEVRRAFFTQLNIESIQEALRRLDLPLDLSHNIMDRFAYTGSAAIPMAIADAVRARRLRKGDLVLLIGSGGGMAMGALAMTWGFDT